DFRGGTPGRGAPRATATPWWLRTCPSSMSCAAATALWSAAWVSLACLRPHMVGKGSTMASHVKLRRAQQQATIAHLPPVYFSLVMATGIVATAAHVLAL